MSSAAVHRSGDYLVSIASLDELDTRTLYRLLRLRVDVFVVEQACPYPELDGRDLEPATRHLWVEEAGSGGRGLHDHDRGGGGGRGEPLAYLRLLAEPDGTARIGRVCTATGGRGRGLAGLLMRAALVEVGRRRSVLEAQSHLQGWYAGFGFVVSGAEYVEDGIPHVPMARPGQLPPPSS